MNNRVQEASFLQSIFDASLEGIIVVDDDGVILRANPASEQMFGYGTGELAQKKVETLIPDSFKKSHKTHREKYTKNSNARIMGQDLDLFGLKKDGSQLPLEISLSPTKINGKNVVIALLIDITERVLARRAVLSSEYNLAKAQSISHIGSWQWNLQTNERSWSDEFYRICGLPPGDHRLNSETVIKFIHPADREGAIKSLNYAIENQKPYNIEKRILWPDGSVRHVLAKGKVTYGLHKEPMQMFGTMQDITEQLTSKQQLKKSELRNRALLMAIPDFLYVLNRQGVYLDAHAPDTTILPVPREELVGNSIYDILPTELSERIMKAIIESEKTRLTQILDYSILVKGELRYYEARIVAKDNGNFLAVVRDITSRKTMDNLLSISYSALAVASSGIVIVDAQQPDLPIIYCNTAFLEATGYDKKEVVGHNRSFLQGNDIDQEEFKIMVSAIEKGEACSVVLRNYRKDGSLFWNEISITPVYDDQRVLTHFIHVQNDVTARKKEELLKSAINYVMDMIIKREPLEQIGDKIIETIETAIPNCMGSILLLNKEHRTLHKLSAPNISKAFGEAIEGTSIGNKTGSCGTAAYLKKEIIVTDIAKSPLWEDYKELALSEDLRACWSFPVFSSNEDVLGTFALYFNTIREPLTTEKDILQDIIRTASVAIEQQNISNSLKQSTEKLAAYTEQLENKVTERTTELNDVVQKLTESNLNLEDQIQETKEAENRVLRSKQLLDNISHNFPRGFIAVVDRNFIVVLIEGEEVNELGFTDLADKRITVDKVIGVPQEIKAEVINNIEKTFKGEHCSFEINFLDRCYQVNTTPLRNNNNSIERVLLVHNNISLQKMAELEILNTLKKEQELSGLKSRFVSTASHEFRTPLTAILTATNLIERQNAPGKEDKRLDYVSRIKSSVNSLVALLNDFLSLGKLEEGKVVAQPTAFDMIDFSKTLIDEIQENKKSGQAIQFIHDQSSMEVFLDPKLLRHITHNLLSNAIKYSEENKQITYKINGSDNQLQIEVVDQGIGIPVEDQDRLFQRFHRAKNATNIQGTGLGLNIVKQYTKLMGGTISFKSKLNEGTTFLVELPLNLSRNEENIVN